MYSVTFNEHCENLGFLYRCGQCYIWKAEGRSSRPQSANPRSSGCKYYCFQTFSTAAFLGKLFHLEHSTGCSNKFCKVKYAKQSKQTRFSFLFTNTNCLFTFLIPVYLHISSICLHFERFLLLFESCWFFFFIVVCLHNLAV